MARQYAFKINWPFVIKAKSYQCSRKLKQVLLAINFCHSVFDQVVLLWKKRWSYCAPVYDSLFKLDFDVVPDLQKYIFKIPRK